MILYLDISSFELRNFDADKKPSNKIGSVKYESFYSFSFYFIGINAFRIVF